MEKIKLTNAKSSTTMFLIDSNIEKSFDEQVKKQVTSMIKSIKGIDTKTGLKAYITKEKKALENLIVLLGMSKEKFLRIISLVRMSKGYVFESEWSLSHTREEMVKNTQLMEEICELLSNGASSPQYQEVIPAFILEDFKINHDVVSRLKNKDTLSQLVRSKITTNYNRQCGTAYINLLNERINEIANNNGLIYTKNSQIPEIGLNNIDCIIYGEKYIILNKNFRLTTSSGQSDYYNDEISPRWTSTARKRNVLMINILDGAGWIGRNADYEKIYHSCHNFLNLNNISSLNLIIKEFLNIK